MNKTKPAFQIPCEQLKVGDIVTYHASYLYNNKIAQDGKTFKIIDVIREYYTKLTDGEWGLVATTDTKEDSSKGSLFTTYTLDNGQAIDCSYVCLPANL